MPRVLERGAPVPAFPPPRLTGKKAQATPAKVKAELRTNSVHYEMHYLADHPEFISTVAGWHHGEWAYLRPGDTIEARTARLRAECGRGGIPSTFIALSGSTVLGSSALIAHDMDTRRDLTPWLASVFVAADYRRRGIGSALVGKAVDRAAELGVKQLYLYTSSAERLYSQLGWSVLERTIYGGRDAVVMFR
jgi:GNAT superfamily N-acetyltransferase